MPRRMIESNLGESKSLAAVSLEAETVFVHALTVADDQGRLEGEPFMLRCKLFPRRRELDLDLFYQWVEELVSEGVLHRYEVDGEPFLHFPKWGDFQRLRKPGEDRLPSPDGICPGCLGVEAGSEEARSEKRGGGRESAGSRGKPPQVAATRRTTPQVGVRKSSKEKYKVPEALTPEQMQTVRAFVEEKYPDMLEHVDMLTATCLRHHESTGNKNKYFKWVQVCLLYTSPSPRDATLSRMPSSA